MPQWRFDIADSVVKVLQHFWPRFSGWWQQEGHIYFLEDHPAGCDPNCESERRFAAADLPEMHEIALDIAVHRENI